MLTGWQPPIAQHSLSAGYRPVRAKSSCSSRLASTGTEQRLLSGCQGAKARPDATALHLVQARPRGIRAGYRRAANAPLHHRDWLFL